MKELHIVLKISERCNLACTYCYFFFGSDNSYRKHPPLMKSFIASQLITFVQEAVSDLSIKKVVVVFHGGEPLLMKKNQFSLIVKSLKESISPICCISFSVQTNGILIDKEWIEIFKKFDIFLGISLDGPEDYNDVYRIDKKSQGSHKQVLNGLQNIEEACFKSISCLSVMNKNFDAKRIYDYLIHHLKFENIDCLLPDLNHDDDEQDIHLYGKFLCDLFDAWIEHDDPSVSVRFCKTVVNLLLGKEEHMIDTTTDVESVILISVGSDGSIYFDDTLRSICLEPRPTIFDTSLKKYIESEEFNNILQTTLTLPDKCTTCSWQKICKGGRMVNRYSQKNGFNNSSIFCDALKMFYEHIFKTLLNNGISLDIIKKSLLY